MDIAGVAPYFDILFERLNRGDAETSAAFGRHVHWGYWDAPQEADGTAAQYGQAAERLTEVVCDGAGIASGARVLDVGCGFGGTIDFWNRRCRNLELTGLNVDPRQLRRAAETVRPAPSNAIQWIEGDACQMPAAVAGPFDAVLAVECIFHFPSRAAFFEQAARRLRPGGRLALSDFVPTPRVAEFFRRDGSPLDTPATTESYGRVDMLTTEDDYRALGDAVRLELVASRDLTPHTLPTYDFLRTHARRWDDTALARQFDEATKLLQGASRKGFIEYRAFTFERHA